VSVDKQGYLGCLTGYGIAGDKTVWYSLQGAVGSEEWGFTLGSPLQVGPNAACDPVVRLGDTGEDHWDVQYNSVDGNLEITPLNSVGAKVTTQQVEIFTSVHIQGPETGDTSRSWNTRDEASGGGFGQVAVLDAAPVPVFAREDWYQDLSGAPHTGPVAHFVRTKTASLFGVRYHANVNALQHLEIAPASFATPPAGSSTLFFDSTNAGHATRKDSAGVLHDLEAAGAAGGEAERAHGRIAASLQFV
jgi:hypothetical protein